MPVRAYVARLSRESGRPRTSTREIPAVDMPPASNDSPVSPASTSLPSTSAWLEFPSGESFGIKDAVTSIGRAPTNRLIISTERVSRNHAAIRRQDDGSYLLMDLGSSNGTFLNGQRLSRPVTLRNGWIIEVGLQKMTFRTPPEPVAAGMENEAVIGPCWLLTVSVTQLGCRTPGEEFIDKTFESWSERVQRVVAKHRGRMMRGRDESMIAYWPVQAADPRGVMMAAVLKSLNLVRRQSEEFRLALHYGTVELRRSATGETAPTGPEVVHAVQLDRFASSTRVPVLLTEAGRDALGDALATRRLSQDELRDYRGEHRFYTIAE